MYCLLQAYTDFYLSVFLDTAAMILPLRVS
jgi:hypothetical protein